MKDFRHIVNKLIEEGQTMAKIMPQHYPGPISYQPDSRFLRISMRNFGDYVKLDVDDDYAYAVDPHRVKGYIFYNSDIQLRPSNGLIPVMTVSLRPTAIKDYRQAHALRIRENFSVKGVATHWYFSYARKFGGIVSDFEHLEGGKALWKSFVRTAEDNGFKIALLNARTSVWASIDSNTPDSQIWSLDDTLFTDVLVLEMR